MLSFQLLGAVALFKNGQPLNQFRSQKEAALLIYLAQTGQSHSREFILDNFEHLQERGVQLVLDLLARCEKVQLLVTSCEALRTRAEWTVPLRGLDYPVNDTDAAQSDAVALFAARRAQGRQDKMSPDELVVVRQICRLVEGLPRG